MTAGSTIRRGFKMTDLTTNYFQHSVVVVVEDHSLSIRTCEH